MANDDSNDAATRRDWLRYGGVAVGGGLLAGCAGTGSDAGSTTDGAAGTAATTAGSDGPTTGTATTDAATAETAETTGAGDSSYTVRVEPLGEFTFDSVPERYVANDLMAADIALALGKPELAAGPSDMNRWPTFFYDQLPGVSFEADDVPVLNDEGGYDAEVFYEVDPDVNLVDPGMVRTYMEFSDEEIERLSGETGPFVTPFNVFLFADFQESHPESLYGVFEQMSRVFREEARYEAFASLHDELLATVDSRLPPEDERPAVALLNAGSDPSTGEFVPVPLATPGTGMKPYRDLGLRDALADAEVEAGGSIDYETLLEVDPEVVAVPWQIAVPDEQFAEQFVTPMRNDSVGQQLRAVRNDRVIKGQHLAQGPIVNLFQTEYVAKQYYPEEFGEWPDDGEVPAEERLFDRGRVADIVTGAFEA